MSWIFTPRWLHSCIDLNDISTVSLLKTNFTYVCAAGTEWLKRFVSLRCYCLEIFLSLIYIKPYSIPLTYTTKFVNNNELFFPQQITLIFETDLFCCMFLESFAAFRLFFLGLRLWWYGIYNFAKIGIIMRIMGFWLI